MSYWGGAVHAYTWAEGEDEVPVGTIAMWSSLNGAIPAGWAECDGTANAPGPDLRDRFIVGRNVKAVDTTGGAATHTHTDFLTHTGTAVGNHAFTQPGAHSAHVVTQPSNHTDNIAHTHTQRGLPTTTGALTGWTRDVSMSGTPVNESTTTGSSGTGAALTHTGTAVDAHSAHAGGAVDAHAVTQPSAHGSHAATNHEPAWYALIFIQRMS